MAGKVAEEAGKVVKETGKVTAVADKFARSSIDVPNKIKKPAPLLMRYWR
jgi:hypothetical protein